MYKRVANSADVIRTTDGARIRSIAGDPDFQGYIDWLNEGNMPSDADPDPKPFVDAIQRRLDAFAQTRGYDGILSACTYAASAVAKFAAEGQTCVNLRDATWQAAYQLLAEVQAGTRPMPASIDDIAADLPQLTWGD